MDSKHLRPLSTDPDDDWSDITDMSQRRRLQNRVNQQASRQRKLQHEAAVGIKRRARGRPRAACQTIKTRLSDQPSATPNGSQLMMHSSSYHNVRSGASLNRESAKYHNLLGDLAATVHQGLEHGDPASDLLLSLTKMNVLRAIMSNMSALGISFDIIRDDHAVSCFNIPEPSLGSQNLPISLQPTQLQTSVAHHPWTDPFPFPSLRDALIQHNGEFDETEFCNDVFGVNGTEPVGLIIWTEPWDPNGWEMTEVLARKWKWLLQGCVELQASTTYWRSLRGEHTLLDID
ncbi:hypothetical protein VFPPC_03884 [Pochonia chlamydosporia 170]|uniref:BZIP domain-containing protein n=1 Tax=Pochonia chlamydosporia 170 TaxID=1380566 RepID=A0A179F2K4_METCM|nr:hypothetical protein VFPPC_03884 [Pochonia chlamydosporia 170]OAQ59675.1 hypothetical protein VFPPC_03884 [Pochonia chlamydosporia 170]